MAYIPSWTENPAFQQGIQGFLQNLLKGIAPDYTAQQTFQQLAQQDPSLVERISNMDEGERETYSKQVLGSRNKNPLANIGIGAKRAERERIAAARASLTKEQQEIAAANELGTLPTSTIDRRRVLEGREDETYQDTRQRTRNALKKDQFEIGKLEKDAASEEEAIAAYPEMRLINIKAAADAALDGTLDPILMERIERNPGLKEAFEKRIDTREKEIAASVRAGEIRLSAALAKDRDASKPSANSGGGANDPNNEVVRNRQLGSAYTKGITKINSLITERAKLLASDKNLKNYLGSGTQMQQAMLKMVNAETAQKIRALDEQIADEKERNDFIKDAYDASTATMSDVLKQRLAGADSSSSTSAPEKITIKVQEAPPATDKSAAILAQRIEAGAANLEQVLNDTRVPQSTKDWLKKRYGR